MMKMVNVGNKKSSSRQAVASCLIKLKKETLVKIKKNKIIKGNPLEASKLTGIAASKFTPFLLPFCHPVSIDCTEIEVKTQKNGILITSSVRGKDRTGFEMEALFACALAALNIYDMCKKVDSAMVITDLKLKSKRK